MPRLLEWGGCGRLFLLDLGLGALIVSSMTVARVFG
jgi:hypothetical protein